MELRAVALGIAFESQFSPLGTSPHQAMAWEFRAAEITDETRKTMFCQEHEEVPSAWSKLAIKIAVSIDSYGDATLGNDPHRRVCSMQACGTSQNYN